MNTNFTDAVLEIILEIIIDLYIERHEYGLTVGRVLNNIYKHYYTDRITQLVPLDELVFLTKILKLEKSGFITIYPTKNIDFKELFINGNILSTYKIKNIIVNINKLPDNFLSKLAANTF